MSEPLIGERVVLRRWREEDLLPFGRINADPLVMEFMPGVMSRSASDALAARIRQGFESHGFGLWAVELPEVTSFAGFIGLSVPNFDAYFTPCVEVGWRLAREHWGFGYATEGAQLALHHAFGEASLNEVVSFRYPTTSAPLP